MRSTPSTKTVKAALYVRISKDDDDTRLGVERQEADCRELADRKGWTVVDVYSDNDVSATLAKVRPDYVRMLADVERGRVDGIVTWDLDRLTRKPRELEDLIDLADKRHLALASVGGEVDLATGQGRLTARVKGAVARGEAEQMSRRITRKLADNAAAGHSHGQVAYGWQRVVQRSDTGRITGSRDVLHPVESTVLLDAVASLRAGNSLRATAKMLNDRGEQSPGRSAKEGPRPWTSQTLRQMLVRPRNAGQVVYHGEVLAGVTGQWDALWDLPTHEWLIARLNDPARRTENKGSVRVNLLTGVLVCGRCGSRDWGVNIRRDSGHGVMPRGYVCDGCHLRRSQEPVDAMVEEYVLTILERPDALELLATGDEAAVQAARESIEAAQAKMREAGGLYAADVLTAGQVKTVNEACRAKIEDAERTIAANLPRDLPNLAGEHARELWAEATVEQRHAVVKALVTVTILPAGRGKIFDPTKIVIEPSA